MRFEQTSLDGVLLMVPEPFRDERGLFTRTFDAELFNRRFGDGASAKFIQDSQSRSVQGVVRGLHGRTGAGEAKLVRCAHGAIFDVVIDGRRDSPTFGKSETFLLDDVEFRHLYIPAGFLHGFQAITPVADVCYRIDRAHQPREDVGVNPHDADLAIAWPQPVTAMSNRDAAAGTWREFVEALD